MDDIEAFNDSRTQIPHVEGVDLKKDPREDAHFFGPNFDGQTPGPEAAVTKTCSFLTDFCQVWRNPSEENRRLVRVISEFHVSNACI